ncbi:GNAT family N-acetyltransferase [Primorskyibacter sp. S87]|uniref:GNAT family N-acetyltransferase n=1 Tax=Primorskyibacter sp. S87 TaxID=3415126 RepID=UPI003C7DF890
MSDIPVSPDLLAETHKAAFTQSRGWSSAEIEDLLTNRFTHFFGDARCFALVQVISDEAELLTIATHPDFQKQGLAQRCMSDWLESVARRGVTRAFLDVAEDNLPAAALYEACGFAACGRRQGYYRRSGGKQIDAILMERQLP